MLPNASHNEIFEIEILKRSYGCGCIACSFVYQIFKIWKKQVWGELHFALFKYFVQISFSTVLCMLFFQSWWNNLACIVVFCCCKYVCVCKCLDHITKLRFLILAHCTCTQWMYSAILMVIIIIEFAANFNHNPSTIPFTRCIYNFMFLFRCKVHNQIYFRRNSLDLLLAKQRNRLK